MSAKPDSASVLTAYTTRIPILLDGDTGYGNFNNVRRLVRKLDQRDIAAVCIEDKLYPKTNSFIDGNKQQLAEVDELVRRGHSVRVVYTTGHWLDVDSLEDVLAAGSFA